MLPTTVYRLYPYFCIWIALLILVLGIHPVGKLACVLLMGVSAYVLYLRAYHRARKDK